jgi:hypothetical protein
VTSQAGFRGSLIARHLYELAGRRGIAVVSHVRGQRHPHQVQARANEAGAGASHTVPNMGS